MRRPTPPPLLAIACSIATLQACRPDRSWSYDGDTGPDHWASLDSTYAACASGMRQSPIDLAGATPRAGSALGIRWRPGNVQVLDNGHAIQVDVEEGSAIVLEGRRFSLAQFHFHLPSEHTVDGESSPMEIHFVHRAEDGEGDLAVIGIFAHVGEVHPAIEHVRNAIPGSGDDPGTLAGFNPRALLPAGGGHLRYDGSLTTPPCSEVVSWVVMTESISVSQEQVDAFAALYPMNARPTQPLNGRSIRARG